MSWQLASFAVLAAALGCGFAWYERSSPSAKVLALVATLAALAAVGRIAFAPLPNVKPTTDIVLISGYALGGAPGFAVGALAALASNLFFGQGPWTPWQMAAWGGVGLFGAGLATVSARRLPRWALAVACAFAGLAYGEVLNLSTWITFNGDHSLAALVAIAGAALPFDVAHAVGNLGFALAFGPALARMLIRFRARFDVAWVRAPAAAAILAALLVAVGAGAPPARAASSLTYLQRAQNADGGFGPAPGTSSTELHTGWAALGLAAAGRNPLDVRRGGRSPIDFVRSGLGALTDTGELERTILVLRAGGLSPRSFGGRDLLAALLRRRRSDGSLGGQVNLTAFGIAAFRSAGLGRGSPAVARAGSWLAAQQNRDGGFNFFRRGGPSGIDDTGAALQGLSAAGLRRPARRGARFLAARQNRDGGFGLQPGEASNAQSTAWAVQGLLAGGRDPARLHRRGARSPFAYLRSLTAADGSVRYSRTSAQTPVWVTAQALAALARRTFPLAVVPRAGRRARSRAAAATPRRSGSRAHRRARPRAGGTAALLHARLLAAAGEAGFVAGVLMAPLD